MIFAQTFRRRDFEFEGCSPCLAGLTVGLACHKGDAAQEQSNTQVGAQPGGSAVEGSGNSVQSSTGANYSISVNNSVSDSSPSSALALEAALAGQPPPANSPTTNINLTDQGALAAAQAEVDFGLECRESE